MRRLSFALILGLATACTTATPALPTLPPATATPAPSPTPDRAANWRADLATLAKAMPLTHPNLFWRVSQADFEAAVAKLDAEIPEKTDSEIIVEMSRIVSLADGHSFLPLFQEKVDFQLYPLRFYQFSDGLYVVSADEPHAALAGAKVVQIGRLSAEEAYAAVAPLVPHDNDMTVALLVPVYLNVPEVLLALGIIDNAAEPGFVLEQPDGTRTTLNVAPISSEPYRDWLSTHLVLAGVPGGPEPLWLSRKNEEFFWYTLLEDSNTLYIQYNLVWETTQSGQTIQAFADEVNNFASEHAVDRTIVDVRHNLGGDNFAPLAQVLEANAQINQPGRLYVLTGRQTFSAAMQFSVALEETTQALFVGEPTGGSPNFYTHQNPLVLPQSGIEVLLSSAFSENSTADDTRPWIEPDIPVVFTAADYFGGRDPVLEAALAADE